MKEIKIKSDCLYNFVIEVNQFIKDRYGVDGHVEFFENDNNKTLKLVWPRGNEMIFELKKFEVVLFEDDNDEFHWFQLFGFDKLRA